MSNTEYDFTDTELVGMSHDAIMEKFGPKGLARAFIIAVSDKLQDDLNVRLSDQSKNTLTDILADSYKVYAEYQRNGKED